MNKILVPTEFTYLSTCALELGIQLADLANAKLEVASNIETFENAFIERGESFSNDPTSSVKNIQLTEAARARMHERVEEIQERAPNLLVTPKILYGDRVISLLEEIDSERVDLVIMGGDLYEPTDKKAIDLLRKSNSPVLVLKCMISGLDRFKDIIFLADMEKDSSTLIAHLKELQRLLDARIHVLRINTPKNFLSKRKCAASLEQYAERYQLENHVLVSKDAKTEKEGLLAYCDTIEHAFVATAVHERSFLRSLMNNKNEEGELIANSVHPLWMFRN